MAHIADEELQQPLMVSIHCIAYNQATYIRQCLDGFVMQKTNFRFEAIVHDDASTDGTAEIIKEYAEKYPDIIKPVLEKENQYSKRDGSLRRIMDENMYGKYIALCEGDDYWVDSNKLQMQVDFMESHPDYTMCWTNAYQQFGDTLGAAYNRYPKDVTPSIHDIIMNGGLWVPTASILVRNNTFLSRPIDPKFHVGDYPLQIWSAHCGLIRYLATPTCVYRINSIGSWSYRMRQQSKEEAELTWKKELYLLGRMDELTLGKYKGAFEQRRFLLAFNKYLSLGNIKVARKYYRLLENKPDMTLWLKLLMNEHVCLSKIVRSLQLLKHRIVVG